jgi:hypothetical protein
MARRTTRSASACRTANSRARSCGSFNGLIAQSQPASLGTTTTPSLTIIDPALSGSVVPGTQALVTTDLDLFVSPTGSDTSNNGISPTSPFATLEKALAYGQSHLRGYRIHMAAGTYALTQKVLFPSLPVGPFAVPVAIIGGFANLYGTRVADTSNNAGPGGTFFSDGTLAAVRSSATNSIVAGAGAGKVRVNVAGYTAADIGSQVLISGAASAGNNIDCAQIFAVNPGVSIDIINAQGVAGDANNGAITVQDSLVGGFLECISGANAGQRRMIRSNTTTSFAVNTPFGSAITAGDTFNVERPNVTIQYPGLTTFYATVVGFTGVKFQSTGPGGGLSVLAFNTEDLMLEGCEFDGSGSDGTGRVINALRVNFASGIFNASQLRNWQNDTTGVFSSLRTGSGTFLHNFNVVQPQQGGQLQGVFVMRSVQSLNFTNEGTASPLVSLDAARVTASVQNGSIMTLSPQLSTYPSIWNGQYTNSAAIGLITFSQDSSGSLSGIALNNSGGDAVLVMQNSAVTMSTVTGAGNVGAGIHVDRNGYVQIDSAGPVSTSVTGTLGDTKFGHPTVANIQTYATIRTPDGNGVKGFQDIYGNRIEP